MALRNLIVKATLATAKKYAGRSVTGRYGSRKYRVYFSVDVDENNVESGIEQAANDRNIVHLNYTGAVEELEDIADFKGVYITQVCEMGVLMESSDVTGFAETLPKGVTPVVRLHDEYKDIRKLVQIAGENEGVRFVGGTLFCFDDLKVGFLGRDVLDTLDIEYNDASYTLENDYSILQVANEEDVELMESTVPATVQRKRTKKTKSATDTSEYPSGVSPEQIQEFFGDDEGTPLQAEKLEKKPAKKTEKKKPEKKSKFGDLLGNCCKL